MAKADRIRLRAKTRLNATESLDPAVGPTPHLREIVCARYRASDQFDRRGDGWITVVIGQTRVHHRMQQGLEIDRHRRVHTGYHVVTMKIIAAQQMQDC